MPLDVQALRSLFPALARTVGGRPAAYLDGPAGTQVPQPVIDAISAGLVEASSNVGGAFAASAASGRVVEAARVAGADLLGADPGEIVFGPNMTTLTFAFSRAVATEWRPGDRIVLSRLDHDANVTPWARAAEERGVEVVFADLHPGDVTLDLDHLESLLTDRTRLVAVTACSNAIGSRVDVARVAASARRVGALSFIDAVHLAPHARIDVRGLGCDALVCSAYKFFGPHVGLLWGRRDLLERLPAYKVRPAPAEPPGKFETGTPSFALLAGVEAAVDYLAGLGEGADRRTRLDAAYEAITAREAALGRRFLAGLPAGVRVWGRPSMEGRVPTFAVEVAGLPSQEVAARLGDQGLFVWAGHYYAVEPMARLGLLERGGLTRIGFVHTTTEDEVDRLLEALSG
jgi:cysteine desulfurase family protein (TIGR01976 family)